MNTRIVGTLPVLFALLLGAPAAEAQVVTLDEGAFRVEVDGVERGTETFTIRRSGIGTDASIILAVQIDREDGDLSMRPMLEADSELRPRRYENQISGQRASEISMMRNGRRFSATVVSERGESAQEFRAGSTTAILTPRVASLYWFLSPFLGETGTRIEVIEPEAGGRPSLDVVAIDSGELRIGRDQFPVRIVTLGTGEDIRRVWFDDQGRVLRVEVPSQQFSAERQPER